ncbi:MAG: peptidylprolyl isomerase [Salibacteraceae bacterium]
MNARFTLILLFIGTWFSSYSQDERTLLSVGGDDVTVHEFLSIYNKNNTNNVVDKKTMDEYMDLFINFKLKVREAESLGMDTLKKFTSELAGYRKQLAQPYLIDKSVNDQLIEEAYERMTKDVAAYHILVRVGSDAAPSDTAKALAQLKKLSEGIKSEADMIKAIDKVRQDNDEATIAEDLGYFTAFSMVYPFESAAYKTPVGELSKPVRTRFGYHVIFVKDKRPARGEVRVSHIFIRANAEMNEDQKADAKARIDEIYQQIQAGAAFDEMVKQYSEDKASAPKGGMLPWFGTGGTATVFEDAAFGLERVGSISEPILSAYGWHIIRKEDARPVGSFDELKTSLKKRIEKDSRSLKGRTSLISKLKKEYALAKNIANRNLANKLVTSEFLQGKWKVPTDKSEELNKPVLTITDNKYSNSSKNYTQLDYLKYLQSNQKRMNSESILSSVIESHWDGFVEEMLIDFENNNLEAKYPDFKALMQEYHDGILLFDLMDQRVWSKAVRDTAGLEAYYEAHKMEYMWPERVDATIYTCANSSVAKQTLKLAKKRIKKGYSDSDIMEKVDAENPLDLSISSGIFAKENEVAIEKSPWMPGVHEVDVPGKPFTYVQIYKILEPAPKPLEKARGAVTSDYQAQLEKEWIADLKSKYEVEINDQVFQEIKK